MRLFVQETNHGGTIGYVGTPPGEALITNTASSLPPELKYLEKWQKIEEEKEKVVDEIAASIKKRLFKGDPYVTGCVIIALYTRWPGQGPSFHPFPQPEGNGELPRYGLLELSGDETWVLVDGKFRQNALSKVLSSMTRRREELAQNPIPVIFLPMSDPKQLEDLIVRMQKSARMVTRGETIRTAIGDTNSVYAGWLKGDDEPTHPGAIAKDLVNWTSNTITNRLPKFTTLSTLYDSAKILDQAFGKQSSPTPEQIDERYLQIYGIWKLLLEEFPPFHQAVSGPPHRLPFLREQLLCVRPTGQLIVMHVMALAIREQVSFMDVVQRLKLVSWEMTNPLWKDMIIVEGRVNGRSAATQLTAKLVAYLIGIPSSDSDKEALRKNYKKGKEDLPPPLFKQQLRAHR